VEAFLGAYALYYAAMEMQPAERSAVTRLGGVRKTRADPNSALSAYYGARRVLGDFGSYLPPMRSVLLCLKGLRVRMIEEFGDDCFAKVQAQPWPQRYLNRIISGCATYSLPFWSPAQHDAFLDAFIFSLSLGARKVELPRYRLSNVEWLNPDMGESKATDGWIQQVTDGWWCRVAPVCSKTDYDNAKYGSTRMWFKVDSSDPWNIASRLLSRERRHSCAPDLRHSTALLIDPSTNVGVSGNTLVKWLDDVKAVYIDSHDAELASLLTWHASRVTLASKLVKIKKPWERVQTLVRWEAVASARIYGRAEAEAYHADISAALAADAAGAKGVGEIDPVSALHDIDAALASESDEKSTSATARAAEANTLRGSDNPAKARRRKNPPKPSTVPSPPPSLSKPVTLANGDSVNCFTSDSWMATGLRFSIPESVWTLDSADTQKLRYEVAGLTEPSGCYVVRVIRGAHSGEAYLVGPNVIKALLNGAERRKAGNRLRSVPVAV
jgi:hypothetical protein